jgi:hypothetical protein
MDYYLLCRCRPLFIPVNLKNINSLQYNLFNKIITVLVPYPDDRIRVGLLNAGLFEMPGMDVSSRAICRV